jgi:hypothetical protein
VQELNTSILRLAFPCICTFATLHAQVQDGEKAQRAARSAGKPRRGGWNVERPGGAGLCGRRQQRWGNFGGSRRTFSTSSFPGRLMWLPRMQPTPQLGFLPRKFYTVCYAVLRNSEETRQVGFASIKSFPTCRWIAWRSGRYALAGVGCLQILGEACAVSARRPTAG